MIGDDATPEQIEEWLSTCVALLRAGQDKDFDRMEQLIESAPDLRPILIQLTGIANRLGYNLHGRRRFARLVASRQPGQGIPGIHRPPSSGHAQLN